MLADPFKFGDVGTKQWTLPEALPTLADIQTAVDHLEWKMIGAGDDGVAQVVTLMITAGLAMKEDDPTSFDARLAIYQATLNDVPADLLEAAFLRIVKEETFFPQVAVFRHKCEREFSERRRMLDRAKRIREAIINPPGPNGSTFTPEPKHIQIAGKVASFTRHGMPGRAAPYVAELWALAEAERAKETPAEWAAENYIDLTLKRQEGRLWVDDPVRVFIEPPAFEEVPPEPLPGALADALASASDETAGDMIERVEAPAKAATRRLMGDLPREEPPPRQEDEGGAQALDW